MPGVETNILERATRDWERIFERMRRNREAALEIIGDIELNDLSPEIREQLYDQIHTLREIVRLLSPDFEEKVIVETAKLGRALSRERFKVCCTG